MDVGPLDAGPLDAGPLDAGSLDAGSLHAGLRQLTIILLVFGISIGVWESAGVHGEEPPVPRRVMQARVRNLVKRYRQTKDDLEAREQLAAEAIEAGPAFVQALLPLSRLEASQAVPLYRSAFARQIDGARRIDRASVLASSEPLRDQRDALVRLIKIPVRLRDHLQQDARQPPADPDNEPKPAAKAAKDDPWSMPTISTDQYVERLEQELVDAWLKAKGYQALTAIEQAVVVATNRHRAAKKLPLLKLDYRLCLAARDHSHDMVTRKFFSHTSKIPAKKTYVDRARRMKTSAIAENIGSAGNAETVVSLWMASTGHRKNILSPYATRVGIGHVQGKFTIMFGR